MLAWVMNMGFAASDSTVVTPTTNPSLGRSFLLLGTGILTFLVVSFG